MKILIISPHYFPETFSINAIANELSSQGHVITILTGRPSYGKPNYYPGYEKLFDEKINNVNVLRVNQTCRSKSIFSLFKYYFSLRQNLKKRLSHIDGKEFDIVISHALSPLFFSLNTINRFCKKYGLKHLHYGLDLCPESFVAAGYIKLNGLLYKLLVKKCRKIYGRMDYITFSSPSAGDYFKNVLKLDVKFKHIYQPCLTKVPSRDEVGKYVPFSREKLQILYCGSVTKFLHMDIMINALNNPYLRSKVELTILGDGSRKNDLIQLTKQLHLEDNVHFLKRVQPSETIEYYKNADVLFIPLFNNCATSKLIPQKALECLMYHRPIFGMLVGDGRDIIRNASNKNIISDQNPQDIQNGLMKLLSYNSSEMYSCGEENYNYFINSPRFYIDQVCKELLECVNELLNK